MRMRGVIGLLFCLLIVGCGESKKQIEEAKQRQKESAKEKLGKPMMQPSHTTDAVSWKGASYKYSIKRNPSTQEFVLDENQVKFFDNQVELKITKGGEPFFLQLFTKKNFAPYISKDFQKKGILEAIVFDKAAPDGLYFATSICYPQTDLFIPLVIVVNSSGKMTIRKDTTLDTEGEAREDNEATLHDL